MITILRSHHYNSPPFTFYAHIFRSINQLCIFTAIPLKTLETITNKFIWYWKWFDKFSIIKYEHLEKLGQFWSRFWYFTFLLISVCWHGNIYTIRQQINQKLSIFLLPPIEITSMAITVKLKSWSMNFSHGKLKTHMIKYIPFEIGICDVDFKRFNFLIKSMLQRARTHNNTDAKYVQACVWYKHWIGQCNVVENQCIICKSQICLPALVLACVSLCTLLIESFFRAITTTYVLFSSTSLEMVIINIRFVRLQWMYLICHQHWQVRAA